MDGSEKPYAKLNKPVAKGHTLYKSIYITHWKMQNGKDRNQTRGKGGGKDVLRSMRVLLGTMEMSYSLTVMVVT